MNLDGSNDRVLLSIRNSQLNYVQNLHLAWPRGVTDWFVASFFPNANHMPSRYVPYLDEIVQIRTDGTHRILARSWTAYSAATPQSGGAQNFFWAQPLARPSADGTRINFNSNAAGTIDQYLLWVDPPPPYDEQNGGVGTGRTGARIGPGDGIRLPPGSEHSLLSGTFQLVPVSR